MLVAAWQFGDGAYRSRTRSRASVAQRDLGAAPPRSRTDEVLYPHLVVGDDRAVCSRPVKGNVAALPDNQRLFVAPAFPNPAEPDEGSSGKDFGFPAQLAAEVIGEGNGRVFGLRATGLRERADDCENGKLSEHNAT